MNGAPQIVVGSADDVPAIDNAPLTMITDSEARSRMLELPIAEPRAGMARSETCRQNSRDGSFVDVWRSHAVARWIIIPHDFPFVN